MNPLSSPRNLITRLVFSLLAVSLISTIFQGGEQIFNARPVQLGWAESFDSYGFEVIGFTARQMEIIESPLSAYARVLGGPDKLRKIIFTYNHGKNWKISYAPEQVGANCEIKLSPSVFSIRKSIAANFSLYGSINEMRYSQIVIGHEIGHLLVHAAQERTAIDWSSIYEQRVERDWLSINDPHAPEEEAVTELSLKVLEAGYFFSLSEGRPETNPVIMDEIEGWIADFLEQWFS